MVRTYAFNPSTQSAGLPGNRKPPPEQQLEQIPHLTQHPLNGYHALPQQQVYEVFQQQPFDASLSSSSLSSGPLPPQIIPGSTQLFGIRSVLIDGQHFYQPIDPQLNQLINKEFATLGIIKNNNNIPKHEFNPPADPGPSNQNYLSQNSVGLAAFHIANQPYLNASQSFSNNQISRPDSLKTFSEFDPAIQKNHVGISSAHNNKVMSAAVHQHQNDKNMIDDLPWARGNPQPKSGKRGSSHWNAGQQISKVPSSFYTLNDPFTLSGKLVDSGRNSLHAPPPAASLYHFDTDAYSSLSSAPPLPVHLPSLNNMSGSTNSYGAFYNDPLAASRNTYYPTHNPSKFSNSFSQDFPKNEKEQHKYELLKQIEENKQRKEYEKMRERQLDDRERLRSEIFQARQQAEIEAEQRAVKEKALAVERKAARMAEVNSNYANNKPSKSQNRRPPSVVRETSRPQRDSEDMSGPPRKLEWWEKKNTFNEQRQQSPVIPALRNKDNPNQPPSRQISRTPSIESKMRNRTPSLDHSVRSSTPQRRSSSQAPLRRSDSPRPASRPIRPMAQSLSRNSRHSIDSTDVRVPRFDRSNETLRSLDHTHRELEHEQRRVHKAIQENNYDQKVFR